jgi:type II secretory pathway component PulF
MMPNSDRDNVAETLAEIAGAGLPLASGLRALSEEVRSRRIRNSLREISQRLESGESLDAILRESASIPPHLRGLIQSGVESGNLGMAVQHYLNFARESVDISRVVMLSLCYPLVLVLALGVSGSFLLMWIVPHFKKIFLDFGTELPGFTLAVLTVSDILVESGLWLVGGGTAVATVAWLALTLAGQAALRKRLLNMVPVVGTLFHLASLARFCHMLALLIENQVRLPDALRLTGQSVTDPNIREGCLLLAQQVESGVAMSDAAMTMPHFPLTLVQIFRWEKHRSSFADALHASGEIFTARANIQTGFIGVICEPVLICAVAFLVGGIVIALFLPLIKLLNDLS